MLFLAFLFYLVGNLSGLISPYFLFLLLLPSGYLCFYRKEKDARYLLFLLFALAGFLLSFFYPKGSLGNKELTGLVVKSKENYFILYTLEGKYYVSSKGNALPPFSLVRREGYSLERKSKHFESGFRFDSYLKTQGVSYELKRKNRKVLFRNFLNRTKLKNYASTSLDSESQIVFSSRIFKDSLSSLPSYQDLTELSLSSSLSLSGFHLGFLLSRIEFSLGQKHEKEAKILLFFIPVIFLFISGFSYSFRRIVLLRLLSLLPVGKKKRDCLSRLSLCARIRLILEPYSLIDSSFYYAFPFLFLLAIFQNKRETGIKGFIRFYRIRTLFYFPYRLYQNYSFSLLSPLFQRLLVPYSHLLFLRSVFILIFPLSGYLFNYLVKGYLVLTNGRSARRISVNAGKPLLVFTFFYYFLFFLFLILSSYGYPKETKKTRLALAICFSLFFVPDYFPHQEIVFLDVGQGDCTLVRNGRKNILIDTGGRVSVDLAKECLIPYFRKRKISSLDAVLITHYDYDHAGALESLRQNFKVKAVYDRDSFLSNQNVMIIGGIKFRNLNTYHLSEESNDLSAIYQFTLKNKKVLIRGDAPIKVEKKLLEQKIDVDCDYLKVGHHGSKTSSSYDFLKAASPEEAFISVGYKNSYGLPNQEVLNNLSLLSIPYHRTDEEGSIERRLSFSLH